MIRVWIVSVGRQVAGCLRGLEEGGLPAQVNEVVWERGLGPDCTMCAACFSLGGIFYPTGETVFASGCVCTCWCAQMYLCLCASQCVALPTGWHRSKLLPSPSLMLVFVHLPPHIRARVRMHTHFHWCGGVFAPWSVCFPMSVFGPTTNVYTATTKPPPTPPNLITIPPFPPPFYSTPSRPCLLVFAL